MTDNSTLKVQVKLYSIFRLNISDYDFNEGIEVELNKGSRLIDLMERVEIELEKIAMVRLNGRLEKNHLSILKNGDIVELFPQIGGG